MEKTVQGRVAEEVMQQPETITIGGRIYRVSPPTTGTLVMVSREIATLPKLSLDSENLVYDVLREAKNCEAVGRAVAVLIIGSKKLNEWTKKHELERRGIFARLFGKRRENGGISPLDALSLEILDNASPNELQEAMALLVQRMQLGDFFGLTTFLNAVNHTAPTREVGKKTTVSGR